MSLIGYYRTSTSLQHDDPQIDRLKDAGCEKIFGDHGVSGKLAERPEWDKCLAYLRPGDTLVAVKLDRFGRSLRNLVDIINDLGSRSVNIKCLDQGAIDTTTPQGKLLFGILAAIAEFEHDLITSRTQDGLESARTRGRVGGRKSTVSPERVEHARQLLAERNEDGTSRYTQTQVAELIGVSKQHLHYLLNPDQAQARKERRNKAYADRKNK